MWLMLQDNTARLVSALAAVYDQPFDDAIVEGMLSFVRDFLASGIGTIGCESAPVQVLECLQRVAQGKPSWCKRIADLMARVVLLGCGAIPACFLCTSAERVNMRLPTV
jgi:hypothetical protein